MGNINIKINNISDINCDIDCSNGEYLNNYKPTSKGYSAYIESKVKYRNISIGNL